MRAVLSQVNDYRLLGASSLLNVTRVSGSIPINLIISAMGFEVYLIDVKLVQEEILVDMLQSYHAIPVQPLLSNILKKSYFNA